MMGLPGTWSLETEVDRLFVVSRAQRPFFKCRFIKQSAVSNSVWYKIP